MKTETTLRHDRNEHEILLQGGLVGFPQLRRWLLVENEPPLPLKWLESQEEPGFRLPVTAPGYFDPEYAFELNDAQETELGGPEVEDLAVLIATTVHSGGERITGNLAAPIVVNTLNRKGLQCVLDERKYSLHAEIDSVRFALDLPAEDDGAESADRETSAEHPARETHTREPEPVLSDG